MHGCIYTLESLVKKLPANSNLIFVGDLVDKGKYSAQVVEFVKSNNYKSVYGNHERFVCEKLYNTISKDKKDSHWAMYEDWGGAQTIQNYSLYVDLVRPHIAWLKSLPKYILINGYFITHGFGLPYFQRRDEKSIKEALYVNRITDKDAKTKYCWEDYEEYEIINIFGHCPFDEVLVGKNYFGIDTGCVYGGKLTAISLNEHKIIQSPLDKRDL